MHQAHWDASVENSLSWRESAVLGLLCVSMCVDLRRNSDGLRSPGTKDCGAWTLRVDGLGGEGFTAAMAIEEWRNRISPGSRMWFVVIGTVVWVSILAAHVGGEPAGFLSIDCGATTSYLDAALNITWETDEKYTSVGENAVISASNATFLYNPMPSRSQDYTIRRFTGTDVRFCYTLPTTLNTTYLVRATFLPQNYAGKFDVAVEGTTIKTVDGSKGDVVETVLTVDVTTLHFCLIRVFDKQYPYISTLELRPLDGGMYATWTRQQGAFLYRLDRHNFGIDDKVSPYLRYPDDPFDRIWVNWLGDFAPLNTTRPIDTRQFAPNQPPSAVMATARRLIGFQTVQWREDVKYYIAMYFAELDANASTVRTFSVDLDTAPWLQEFNIANKSGGPFVALQVDKTYTTVSTLGNVTFTPSVGSSDKPILNAIEVYQVFETPLAFSLGGSSSKSTSVVPAVAGASAGGLILLCVVVLFFVIRRRRRKAKTASTFEEDKEGDKAQDFQSHTVKFTLRELRGASNDFSKKIGEGGFGPVYYGKLASGQEIAIKVSSETSKQGENEFRNEVDLLSRIHHKSLVSLIGYCQERNQMLIYEYMPSGTLRDHLYGQLAASAPLDWSTRVHLALDAAQGLEYLHMACSPNIIHRDVKSSNILLTARMEAKVSDFGLSKLALQEGATHVSTLVKGTAGYLDPEYYSSQKLTVKSDVYSFGVVLLELVCGRPPIDPRQRYVNIIDMVRPLVQAGDVEGIVDPNLHSDYSLESMWKVVEAAMTSVEPREVHRPDMQQVVQELREAVTLEDNRRAQQHLGNLRTPRTQTSTVAHSKWRSSSTASDFGSGFSTSQSSGGPTVVSLPLAR